MRRVDRWVGLGLALLGAAVIISSRSFPAVPAVGVTRRWVEEARTVAGDRPATKAFVAAWERDYGKMIPPGFIAVGAYDAMDMIYTAIREQGGKVNGDQTMKILSNYKNPNSPRGPISIDPATRDIVQNIYIRETRKVGGRNLNVEIETVPNVKDPGKEFNKP